MSKTVKTVILEHWFGIDRVLFGEKSPKSVLGEKIEEYESTKAAFLSNLHEIYLKTGYTPTRKWKVVQEMADFAFTHADKCKAKAGQILEDKDVLGLIKLEVEQNKDSMGLTESAVMTRVVDRRYKSTALDLMTVGDAIREGCAKCVNDYLGKILLDSHKIVRDKLIDMAS